MTDCWGWEGVGGGGGVRGEGVGGGGRISENSRFDDSTIQRFKDSKFQRFKDSKIQDSKIQKEPGFKQL
jgi:hypothetical protein